MRPRPLPRAPSHYAQVMRLVRRQVVAGLGTAALVGLALLMGVPSGAGAAPAPAPAEVGSWLQVSAGYYHTCAIRVDHHLFCWGQDNRSQLGNGGANADSAVPVEVSGGATWKSVSAGSASTCAIRLTGHLFCWGRDDFGQAGNGPGTTGDQATPVQVGSASDWKSVSDGLGETVCGRRANKRIYCWGRDNNGQVGNGPGGFGDVLAPTAVGTNADWTSVSTGGYHTCGRRSNGRVYCWGDDLDGAVGDGGSLPGADRSVPTQVAGNHADWTSVVSGITHSCGRRASGRLYCWGSDIDGGLGNGGGGNTSKSSPGQVSGGATNWKAVFAGSYVTCATKTTGQLFCWGADDDGQNGAGTTAVSGQRSVPSLVTGGFTDWNAATIGNLHVCARRAASRVYCWGDGFFGQRGDGLSGQPGNAPQPTPVEVL